jgi:tetratricopeptide repeat protein
MRLGAALALLTVALASPLAAGVARADDTERATKLFTEGRALLEQNDVEGARAKFLEAARLAPKGAGILINLGMCEEKLGEPAPAYDHFQRAVAVLDASDDRRAFAVDHAKALRGKVALLRIALGPSVASAQIVRDGRALEDGELGQEEAVDPGAHTIDVHSAGRADRHYSLTLRAGESKSFVAEAGDVSPVSAPAVQSQPVESTPPAEEQQPVVASPSSRSTLTYVLGGVAVVGLAMGTYFEVSGFSKRSDLDSCKGSCPQDQVDSARSTMLIGDISLGLGLAAAAAATYLYLTRPGPQSSAVAVVPLPGGASAAGVWKF